jgi:hypothetical protein
MQGTFDQPPVVIKSSALKSFALMAGSALVAAFCWFDLSLNPSASHAASGLVAFGLCVPYYAWLFLSPNVLTLSPDGLTLLTRWRSTRWSWDEVTHFRVISVHIASRHVGFDVTGQPSGPVSWAQSYMQYYVGYADADDSLGCGWEMSTGQLADLLNAARARWAPSNGIQSEPVFRERSSPECTLSPQMLQCAVPFSRR